MGILDEDIGRVREATNIVNLVSEHLGLRRIGRRFCGLCPFHAEKSPSFYVNPELGLYHCFGCGAGGDAIKFVRELEHLDFVGAVERLAGKAGITLRYDDQSVTQERRRRDRLVEAVRAAVGYYHQLLLEAPEAGLARRYLRSRGYDGDVARRFELGYSPAGFEGLHRTLSNQKFSEADILEAGLAFVNKAGRLQDFFRNRVMFPIFDVRGDPVGFGGRALDQNGPKYKNSPESGVYQKSRVLYGLHWAKGDIVAQAEAVVCEGYTDVLAFFLSGIPRAVATCGTALMEDHVRVLRNFARSMILAYDADSAGQAAAERVYQWEERYEVRLQVADLPAGQDPADVAQGDPARLAQAVAGARPFLQFRLDRVLQAADTRSVEGRAAAAKAGLRLVAEHPNDLVRDQYLMQLAERLAMGVDSLREAAAAAPVAPEKPALTSASGTERPTPRPIDRRELEGLRVALHAPELVAQLLIDELFTDSVAREAFAALADSGTFHAALERVGGDARVLLERLAVEDTPWGDDPTAYAGSVVTQLVEAAVARQLSAMVRAGDDRASKLKMGLEELVTARSAGDWSVANQVAMQLLPWIAGSGEE
jgi:DNA primase